MPLPNLLNDVPKFQMTVPSTKKEITYRPFLVKEQKILLMALESQDNKQLIHAMIDCIKSCAPELEPATMPTFDIDYLFTQIRGKSIGETSEVTHKCPHCTTENKVKINLTDIKMDLKTDSNILDLTDTVRLKMKYPTYSDMLNNQIIFSENEEASRVSILFETVAMCIDTVMTEDEQIKLSEETPENVHNFIDTLNQEQLDTINGFINNMPTLKYSQKYICTEAECKAENEVEISGVRDFFF